MHQMLEALLEPRGALGWQRVLLAVLASFVLCQLIAATYGWTFRGLSYSRGFVISIPLVGVVATFLMLAIGDSLARGLGLIGAVAMVRFRLTLRDVRDVTFIFAALSVGVAMGVQAFIVGGIGALTFCLFAIHLTFSPFGRQRQFDGLLRLNLPATPEVAARVGEALRAHCSNFVLANLREISQGARLEQSYQVKLREPEYREHLVAALRFIDGVHDVSLLTQDTSLEV